MAASSQNEHEIKTWLEVVLKSENLQNLSVQISGNSEKGDGYAGDIIFATANATTQNGTLKSYNFVFKRSKRGVPLDESPEMKNTFENEIHFYEKIVPEFIKFQKEQNLKDVFGAVPKYYGSYQNDKTAVLVFENLKKSGFELWPKRQALSRKHIDLVLKEYSKLHATSVVFQKKNPKKFQELANELKSVLGKISKAEDLEILFGKPIDESFELLKGTVNDSVLQKWKNFKAQIVPIFHEMCDNVSGLKVIVHGDCWNNNFMFKNDTNGTAPSQVSILDWQLVRYSSPILDLSYFLFSCASKKDLENLEDILGFYHKLFVDYLVQMGLSDGAKLYSFEQFMKDWKCYSRYGIIMASLVMKISSIDKDQIEDVGDAIKSGKHFAECFFKETNDKESYKSRIQPIVENAVKYDLID